MIWYMIYIACPIYMFWPHISSHCHQSQNGESLPASRSKKAAREVLPARPMSGVPRFKQIRHLLRWLDLEKSGKMEDGLTSVYMAQDWWISMLEMFLMSTCRWLLVMFEDSPSRCGHCRWPKWGCIKTNLAIFGRMNIHLPVIWGSLGYQGFDSYPSLAYSWAEWLGMYENDWKWSISLLFAIVAKTVIHVISKNSLQNRTPPCVWLKNPCFHHLSTTNVPQRSFKNPLKTQFSESCSPFSPQKKTGPAECPAGTSHLGLLPHPGGWRWGANDFTDLEGSIVELDGLPSGNLT